MLIRHPDPEYMFSAATQDEWEKLRETSTTGISTTCSIALTLSSLFCNTPQIAPLPNTLMGRFVILHGTYRWS